MTSSEHFRPNLDRMGFVQLKHLCVREGIDIGGLSQQEILSKLQQHYSDRPTKNKLTDKISSSSLSHNYSHSEDSRNPLDPDTQHRPRIVPISSLSSISRPQSALTQHSTVTTLSVLEPQPSREAIQIPNTYGDTTTNISNISNIPNNANDTNTNTIPTIINNYSNKNIGYDNNASYGDHDDAGASGAAVGTVPIGIAGGGVNVNRNPNVSTIRHVHTLPVINSFTNNLDLNISKNGLYLIPLQALPSGSASTFTLSPIGPRPVSVARSYNNINNNNNININNNFQSTNTANHAGIDIGINNNNNNDNNNNINLNDENGDGNVDGINNINNISQRNGSMDTTPTTAITTPTTAITTATTATAITTATSMTTNMTASPPPSTMNASVNTSMVAVERTCTRSGSGSGSRSGGPTTRSAITMTCTSDELDDAFVSYANKLELSYHNMDINTTKEYQIDLDNYTRDIIKYLGGMHSVLQMCLTNDNITDYITLDDLDVIKNIINIDKDQTIQIQTQVDASHVSPLNLSVSPIGTNATLTSTPPIIRSSFPTLNNNNSNSDKSNYKMNANGNIHANINANINSNANVSVSENMLANTYKWGKKKEKYIDIDLNKETTEWRTSNIFIDVDLADCLYFKYLPNTIAQFIVYKVLFSRWYPTSIVITIVLILTISFVLLRVVGYDASSIMLLIFSLILSLSLSSYMFSANIQMCKLIFETFDFSFKMYNLILYNITSYILVTPDDFSIWISVIINILMSVAFFFVFIFDAIMVPHESKRSTQVLMLLMTLLVLIIMSRIYFFTQDDIHYNPLNKWNITEADISVKTLLLQSLSNILIFESRTIMMPLLRHIKRNFCKILKCKKKSNINTNINNNGSKFKSERSSINLDTPKAWQNKYQMEHHRCQLLYKRPKLRWQNPTLQTYMRSVSMGKEKQVRISAISAKLDSKRKDRNEHIFNNININNNNNNHYINRHDSFNRVNYSKKYEYGNNYPNNYNQVNLSSIIFEVDENKQDDFN